MDNTTLGLKITVTYSDGTKTEFESDINNSSGFFLTEKLCDNCEHKERIVFVNIRYGRIRV
jgi:hypothetical protein